jgi:antitoxin component of MazEF toxin-antitoxin module
MIKKLVRHGNSRALIIDKPILELIGANEDSEFTIVTRDGRSLTITPVRSAEEERRLAFEYAAEEVNRTWGSALKRLAE